MLGMKLEENSLNRICKQTKHTEYIEVNFIKELKDFYNKTFTTLKKEITEVVRH